MEYQPPPFFKRGPAPLVKLTFFGLLSILLMVLDARFRYAEPLRQGLALAAYPLQQLAMAPVAAFGHAREFFSSQSELRRENNELRVDKLKTAQDLLTLESLKAENDQLRMLLQAKQKIAVNAIFAEIIYAGRDPFSRKVIIDKGDQDGVVVGQPVIDSAGVLGQVTRALPLLSEVTLITEKNHSIPVQIVRNGLRGIAYGAGDGSSLELRFMPANAEVQNGDVLVTSGLDGVYPRGLPVAKVAKVERDAALAFAKIALTPTAGTNQHRQVLVLSKTEETPAYPQAEPEQVKKGKIKRSRRGE